MIAAGFLLMFGGAFIVGAINGLLIRFANFTAIAATLAMYIGLQGISFLLRDAPGGYINTAVADVINRLYGPIPLAFLVLVAFACAGEYALRSSRLGWQLRAIGSDEELARRIGIRIDRTFVAGYIASSLLTAFGAVMLFGQIGVGDPRQGANYTLSSITAVVLGGTSLRGGRGTFIGTVLGALLLTEVLNAATFLGLSEASHGELWVKSVFIRACVKLRGLFRYPRSEPDCMTRPVSEHDQPHIRSPLETAVPTSRLRRAGAQGTKPFYQSACRAMVTIGSSTRIRQN